MNAVEDILTKHWGFPSFLPHQKEIITSVLEGKDTLAIMATGSGKSLCYQLPALWLGGLTLVISPLISLMKDQVDDLNARGIHAAAYNSSLEYGERGAVEADLKNDMCRLLFVSPEKCAQPGFISLLKNLHIRLIAIDEAHCISEWGHDFRPEYRQLVLLREQFPNIPIIALTATAIPQVRKDIREQLNLSNPNEFIGSFNRKNLHYRVIPKKNALITVLDYLGKHRDESGIIYCLSKQETEDLAEDLRKRGFKALAYHAGLQKQERIKAQEDFIHDNVNIICATVAFGMGIDKPDIRYVIHYDIPKSIESYYQETGRAGRDGLDGDCILLYSRGDVNRVRALLNSDGADQQHTIMAIRKLQDMTDYCESVVCRRKYLLTYFGEEYPETNCGFCDNCDSPHELIDGTEIARKIVGCVNQLPSHFGIELISDVLTGSNSAKIRSHHLDKLSSYNSGKEYSKHQYRIWINDLVRQGYLAREGDQYPVISKTMKSPDVLNGLVQVMLPAPEIQTKIIPVQQKTETLSLPEEKLFLHLKQVRKTLADTEKVPPYVVFSDKSLREMARIKPADNDTFRMINGVGDVKLEKYGPVFIPAIKTFNESHAAEYAEKEKQLITDSERILEQIFELDSELQNLNQKIKDISLEKKILLERALNQNINSQGKYSLLSSVIHVRQLNLEEFKKIYPQVFLEIGSVKMSDADRVLGKHEVNKLCTLKESVTYKVVDTEGNKE
jgi:ATP-dependent DNA helicase RecQ